MDKKTISLKIDCVIFVHAKQENTSYQDEINYLESCHIRNQFITNLIGSLRGNTLVLLTNIAKHGQPLWEMFNPMVSRMKGTLYYVQRENDEEDREAVKEIVEKPKKKINNVILASYASFSKGINIKNINNVVFASPYDSEMEDLLSFCRSLINISENEIRLFDIADDLQCDNYTLKHLKKRINIYKEENFTQNLKKFNLT